MDEKEALEDAKPTCGALTHVWEWRSDLTATCPVSAKCYCGTTTYGAALQGVVTP